MAIIGDFVSGQSNVSYTRMRALLAESGGGLQEGVVGATDLKGSQRAAGANMSVDVAAGAAWIAVDTGTRNGISHAFSDAVANLSVAAAHATLPRIDQVTLRYNDTAVPTGSGNVPTLQVITGTATSGATIDNRLGAAALPNDSVRLFDIFVGPAVASIVTANIRDRRPWAKGAFAEIIYTGAAPQTVPTGAFAAIPTISAAIQQRVECSGTPLIVEASNFRLNGPAASGGYAGVLPAVDAAIAGGSAEDMSVFSVAAVTMSATPVKRWRVTPAAGSHLFTLWGFATGAATITANATDPMRFMVWEDVRPVANNGTT